MRMFVGVRSAGALVTREAYLAEYSKGQLKAE